VRGGDRDRKRQREKEREREREKFNKENHINTLETFHLHFYIIHKKYFFTLKEQKHLFSNASTLWNKVFFVFKLFL
jgi:hypothetical protein